jgi:hypothetical protein
MQIHLFLVSNNMVEDCFSENSTLEDARSNSEEIRLVKWFALRNKLCNSLGGVGKAQRNSIPQSLEQEEDIRAFLKELMEGSKDLRTMKLIVLGDGRIGKTTLLNAMKSVLDPKHHQVASPVFTFCFLFFVFCFTFFIFHFSFFIFHFSFFIFHLLFYFFCFIKLFY